MPKYFCVVAIYDQGESFIREQWATQPFGKRGFFVHAKEVEASGPQEAFDWIEEDMCRMSPRFIAVYPELSTAEQVVREKKPLAEWGEPLVKWSRWEEWQELDLIFDPGFPKKHH